MSGSNGGGRKKITIPTLRDMAERGEKIAWLTAYDYPTALLEDRAGIEMILVGDSAAMCVHGHQTTLPISMDEMISHTRAVTRGVEHAFVVGDMPYMSYQVSPSEAVRNAGRFLAEGGADAVKLEGGARQRPAVEAITAAGIPVMGHLGLTPQAYTQLGGFRSQGRDAESALRLIRDARELQEAGIFALLLEAVPAEVSGLVVERLDIPVFSIGAGPACAGQLLIVHDVLGLFEAFTPRFVKRYAELGRLMEEAFRHYRADVRSRSFPGPEHQYPISDEELARVYEALGVTEAVWE